MSDPRGKWITWQEITTVKDLHNALSMPLSPVHKPELEHVEEDALQFYKRWVAYLSGNPLNKAGVQDFYDWDSMMEYDMMADMIGRDSDQVKAYFAGVQAELVDGILRLRDTEITATSLDFVHVTTWQNFKGTDKDGSPFELVYRCTQLMRKTDKGWKWYHDHFSFSADLKTGLAKISA